MERSKPKGINILSIIIGFIAFVVSMEISLSWVRFYLEKPMNLINAGNQTYLFFTFASSALLSALIAIITVFITEKLIKNIV